MIRVIAGKFRGRKLKVPRGIDIRPTANRVREALFNLLSSMLNWNDMLVLDLFAGSGALGLEALSRGAKKTIFVESSKKHAKILMENIEMLSLKKTKYELIRSRSELWITNFADPKQPCLCFLDPPYLSDEYNHILEKLASLSVIRSGSLIVVESSVTREIMFTEKMELLKHRRYGSITLDILLKR